MQAPSPAYDWGSRDPRWRGIRTDLITVRGHPVRVLRHPGPPERGGVPQLLLHGLGGSATNWLEVAADLGRHGPVVACDLPGFGETALPDGGSARIPASAGFVPALCDTLGWERVVLHGNSMGGLVATLTAALRPDRVHRLILVDPAVPPVPRVRTHKTPLVVLGRFLPFLVPGVGGAVIRRRWGRFTPEALLADSLRFTFADPERLRPAMRRVWLDNLRNATYERWRIRPFVQAAESLMRLLAGREVLAAVDGVTAPTLLVWGEHDRLLSLPTLEGLAARRPDWDVAVIPDAGHCPQMELPETYLQVVGAWLDGQGVPALADASPSARS